MEAVTEPATRGRPRTFDDDIVLDAVVQLFWHKGYEATSMADVVEATGLNKSSLYNSFGSKDDLFKQALDRYVDARSAMLTVILGNGTEGLDDIHALLEAMWLEVAEGGDHRGCLAVNTSTELGDRDEIVLATGVRYRAMLRDALGAALARSVELGELGEVGPELVDAYRGILVSSFLGTAVIVRSGAPNEEIRAQIDAVHALLDSWRS